MRINFTPPRVILLWISFLALLLFNPVFYFQVKAQTPVTAVFTHYTNAASGITYAGTGANGTSGSGLTGNSYTYDFGTQTAGTNNTELLDSFTATGLNYKYVATTPTIVFRRVDNVSATGLRKSLWFEYGVAKQTATVIAPLPPYDDSLERIFSGQIFNIGIDNVFQNTIVTNNNNIERVDVIFPAGIAATTDLTKLGFVVFDRGAGGGHDDFTIAAIQSLDGSGNPSAYFTAVGVTAANYGNIPATSVNYDILRRTAPGDPNYPSGDNELLLETNPTSQQRDGVFLTFSALNVPSTGTKVYGYSIFSTDDNTSTSANMVGYTNAANFPTNSNLGGGGIDQVAVTGLWVTNTTYVVLPDRIEDFQAVQSNDKVQINWQLGVLDQVVEAVVERSGDGVNFSTLLSFPAPLDPLQKAWDTQPLTGENYYRLKLLAVNGSVIGYSPICKVFVLKNSTDPPMLTIYPNPVKNRQFTLGVQGLANETYLLLLFDENGQTVYRQKLAGCLSINQEIILPANLPPGTYVFQLSDINGNRVFTRTILLE